jgi:exocyst complex component 4
MSRVPPFPRAGANGSGSYTNGGYAQYGAVEDDIDAQRRPSAEQRNRDRRPGGYGGFAPANGGDDTAPQVTRPTSLERTRAKRRSREKSYGTDSSRSRSGTRAGRQYEGGSQQIEEILQYIQRDWDFMTNEKCVPVQIALKLLDSSSLGLANRSAQFQQTHQELQRSLKAIVNEHHQGFNSSIGTFHKIQSSLQTSQHRVRSLKESLTMAKSNLSTAKPELKDFATASQNYDEMVQLLGVIEQLQLVPDKLEARISEKHFLTAVDILQDALRMIRKSEMEGIGALNDLRVYLSNQEHSLTDILIEELHNHLYLKSPYCEDRWKAYAHNQTKSDIAERAQSEFDMRGRALYVFLDKLDTSEPMTDDSPRNPEADTFSYIQLILEALNRMNRLDIAIDTIEQRLPIELFKVVEKSNNEVAQRHPSILRAYGTRNRGKFDVGLDGDELRTALLNDLLWTLYARFEAIAESHRVVHDVISGILRRENIRDGSSLTKGFKELWKLYQSEMRSLLHDYLATDGDLSFRGGPNQSAGGGVFSRGPRDKNKRMFKLTDMDLKSKELSSEREDLEIILKTSVPGLVLDSKQPDGFSSSNSMSNLDGSATGHKLLVEPNVFNMGVLLPPSLDFLTRLKEVVPPGSDIVMSTLTSFLDDFLVNVFHPQLDETLVEFCAQTFIEIDAFQQDPQWSRHSKKPIFKGTANFFSLITAFCKMLDALPHDQAFSQLIITQMQTYYDKCYGWYKALVSRSQPNQSGRRTKASAAFAEDSHIKEVVASLFQADAEGAQALLHDEIQSLVTEVEKESLDEGDLIFDRKNITGLCLLYTSMKWLATKIAQLRHISDRATDSSHREPGAARHNRRWTLLTSAEPRTDGLPVYLPLNKETAMDFDGVVRSFQSLASTVLACLHLEIRVHILYSLQRSIKQTYQVDQLLNEPDPAIISLNTEMVEFDGQIVKYIPTDQYRLITTGLSPLMDTFLLHLSKRITLMNKNGCSLMQLNILVLQQNLKNIESSGSLQFSAAFFDLFDSGPDGIVAKAKENQGKDLGFSYEEMKALVELCYSERLQSDRREVVLQAKRSLDDHLLQINEYMWQS